MKRIASQNPKTRAARKRVLPLRVEALATPDTPSVPERLGIEAAQQAGPADGPRRAASDIQRADERRSGSVEAVPGTAGVAGFIEAASEDRDDGPRAAPLEDG